MNVVDKGSFREVNMEAGKGGLLCSPCALLHIMRKKEIIELLRLRQVSATDSCSKKEEIGNELCVKGTEVMAT